MLVIKTGMASEYSIVRKYAAPGILVLTGMMTADDLSHAVPSNATAIISVGLCGGLAPTVKVGELYIASILRTPEGDYHPDMGWQNRLHRCGNIEGVCWWSSGEFNTANTAAQRAKLFMQTKCAVIDDETYAVAQFADKRKLEFAALRAVSDGGKDNLPPAVISALKSDGKVDIWAVVKSVCSDPGQIPALVETAVAAKRSFDSLIAACKMVGPYFQWGLQE